MKKIIEQLEDAMKKMDKMEWALRHLIKDVNLVGGVVRDRDGYVRIASDGLGGDGWPEMAETYLFACEAIGQMPTITKTQEES